MSVKLAHQTQKAAGIGNGMRTATIVDTSPLTISVAGGQFSSGVGVVSSYTPLVGDTVAVFRQDSSWLVLGYVGSNPWVPVTLLNGWTGTFSVRLVRSVGLSMQVAAQMTPGTKTDNTTIAQLSAPFIPATTVDIVGSAGATVAGGQVPHFAFRDTGIISCQGYSASLSASIQAIVPLDF